MTVGSCPLLVRASHRLKRALNVETDSFHLGHVGWDARLRRCGGDILENQVQAFP